MYINDNARANIKIIAAQAIEERFPKAQDVPKEDIEEIVEIVIQVISQYGGKK